MYKKYLLGGLIRGAVSFATKKFLKEGAKKYPPSMLKPTLKGKELQKGHTFRKQQIIKHAHKRLNDLGENMTSFKDAAGKKIAKKQKNFKHFDRVTKNIGKIEKDLNKLQQAGEMNLKKFYKLQGKKDN